MAMKVTKTAIHRLSVDMSCGCKMYAEFTDAQCKESVLPFNEAEGEPLPRIFEACDKHKNESVLEFIIGERLEEAVTDAQKTPIHMHSISSVAGEDISMDNTMGDSITSMGRVHKPKAVRPRSDALEVKHKVRSPEQLVKSGATTGAIPMSGLDLADGEPEDERITPHIESVLDILDTAETGLLSDDED